jgi:hypothetical protein
MTQSDFWLKVWTVGSTCYYEACIALWRSVKRISDWVLHASAMRASVLVCWCWCWGCSEQSTSHWPWVPVASRALFEHGVRSAAAGPGGVRSTTATAGASTAAGPGPVPVPVLPQARSAQRHRQALSIVCIYLSAWPWCLGLGLLGVLGVGAVCGGVCVFAFFFSFFVL